MNGEERGETVEKEKSTIDILRHYGIEEDKRSVEDKKVKSVDFLIGKESDIKAMTCNMADFGTDRSQRVIIEYDKGFGYFVAKRMEMEYGVPKETP